MANLAFALFGPPRLERDGVPLELDTRKAVALLARLALSDGPVGREVLAALLWPELDHARARAALRRTLSVLKKAVGDGVIAVEGDDLALVGDYDLDVAAFRAELLGAGRRPSDDPVALAGLARAITLYRGELLEGFGLRDSAPFDDWQLERAAALRREVVGALERLVEGRERRGDLAGALSSTRRWLDMEPMNEAVHCIAMRLLGRLGRRDEAVHQYRVCVRVLERELGVAPLETTDALYREIQAGRLRLSAHPVPPAPPALVAARREPRAARPLVGRDAAWKALEDAHGRSRKGRFLFAIEGEAGIGKTFLADAFLEWAESTGGSALRARCYPDAPSLPYGPIRELLRAAIAGSDAGPRLQGAAPRWLAEASRLVPDLAAFRSDLPVPAPLDGPLGRARLFEGVDRLLELLVNGARPGVILLDDAQWADPATVGLLAYLARPERLPGVLIVITLRRGRSQAHERLRRLVDAGVREGRAGSVALERWERDELAEFLHARGVVLDTTEASLLLAESEGLPFFVNEYLLARNQPGALGELRRSARDLLHSRLGAAGAVERQLLQTAAVIGRSFGLDLLMKSSGRNEDEVVGGLERLVGLDLVREVEDEDGDVRFDFGHEKLRELVLQETGLARRRLLHGRVANALLADGGPPAQRAMRAGSVGTHLRMAGRDREAALQLALAGDHARALFANEEALHHYSNALALGYPNPASLHEAIGELHTLAGAYESAIAKFEAAVAQGDADAIGRIEHKLGDVHQRRGDWAAAESHYRAAEQRLGSRYDESSAARLLADRGLNALRLNREADAQTLARRALAAGERSGDRRALARVHNLLGTLARRRGDEDASIASYETSLALAAGDADPTARIAALNNLALARAEAEDTDAAFALLDEAIALCRRLGDRHREAAVLANSSDLLRACGHPAEALDRMKSAAALYGVIGRDGGDWWPGIWKLLAW